LFQGPLRIRFSITVKKENQECFGKFSTFSIEPGEIRGLIHKANPFSMRVGKECWIMEMERSNKPEPNTQVDNPNPAVEESPYEAYGWEFHKKPLLYALILTVLFYAFIYFFISI